MPSKRKLHSRKNKGIEEDNSSTTEVSSVLSSTSTISSPTRKRKKSSKRLGSVSKLVRKPFRKNKKKDEYIKKYEDIDSYNDNDNPIENDKSFTRIVEKGLRKDDGKVNNEVRIDDNDNADDLSKDDTRPFNDEENNLPPLLVEEAASPSDGILIEDSGSLNEKEEKVRYSSMDDCTVPQDAVVGNENAEINVSDGEKLKDKEMVYNRDDNDPLTTRSELGAVVEEKEGGNPSVLRNEVDTKISKTNFESKSPRVPDMPVKEDITNEERAVVPPTELVKEKKNEITNDDNDPLTARSELAAVIEEKEGGNPSVSRSEADTKTSPNPAKTNFESKSPRAPDMPGKEDITNDERAVVSRTEPAKERKNETEEEKILRVLEEVTKNSFDTDLSDEGHHPQVRPEQVTTATVIASGGGVGKSARSYIVALLIVTLTLVYVSSTTFLKRAPSDSEHKRPMQYNSNADSTVIRNIVRSRKIRSSINSLVHMLDMDGTDRIDVSNIPSPNDVNTFADIAKRTTSERKVSVVTTGVRSMPKDEKNVDSKVPTILQIKSHNSTVLPPLNDGNAIRLRKRHISPESYDTAADAWEDGTLNTLTYIPFSNRVRDAFMHWDSREPQILIMLATL